MPCIKYSHGKSVPSRLRKFAVGHYGFFKKLDSTREINKERRKTIKHHFANPLHEWCFAVAKDAEKESVEFDQKNYDAGMIVISNAVYCLKHSLSSVDFVRLNNKDALLQKVSATKNDGAEQFFYLRDLIYEKLRQYIRTVFSNIKSASLTLDKVTVSRVAYTVLLSYFFHEGQIHAVLNSLHVMKSTEYDGENTANMVGLDLMASLGITREMVGDLFHHSVYDGVYATPEERAMGGGCLSLNKHFAEWCGVPANSFSGNWDMGHKLQLVYGDVFLTNENIKTLNKLVFGSMGDFTSGQKALEFKELSHELNQPTLSNKKFQETRWARATLGAYASFYRNLPVLYVLYGREAAACAGEGDEDDADFYTSKCNELSNGTFLALGIGVCQLLEVYSKASLDSQFLCSFPTTVLSSITELQEKLDQWADGWEWEKNDLVFASIGSPSALVENLKNGFYKPTVTDNAKKRFAAGRKVDQKISLEQYNELFHDWENVEDLVVQDVFSPDEIDSEQIPIEDFDDCSVKLCLQGIACELKLALSNRLKTTPIITAIVEAFGKYDWYDENKFNSPEQVSLLKQKVTDICSKLEGPFKTKFYLNSTAIDDIVTGYNLFMRFSSQQKSAQNDIRVENIYKKFWLRHNDVAETTTFREFFEFAQGKSYSEAMCESIGSIMNMATANGRNLHPANFGKEIFLRFNLPPMHVLHQRFIPEILKEEINKGKEFIRKADRDARQLRKLNFKTTSSSNGNFRAREEEKFHGVLPK